MWHLPFATEWLTRRRENGWPSIDFIEKIKIYGFIVVKACHPQSDEKDLQWRISFSRQERELVVNFNSVQMMCYVLLKLVKNNTINKEIGEETLTSYHCKTCMFYILENTPEELWIHENLASCLLMCLRQLRLWAMDGNCPNYFIPGENMFDRITSEDSRLKLYEILNNNINSGIESLIMRLTTGGIGKAIRMYGQPQPTASTWLNQCCRASDLIVTIVCSYFDILYDQYSNQIEIFNINIEILLGNLRRTILYIDHTKEERTAISLIAPFLQLTLLTNSAVMQLRDEDNELRATLESEQWDELDVTGFSKLKHASIYLAWKDNATSLRILLRAAQSIKVSSCQCDPAYPVFPWVVEPVTDTEYSLKEAAVDLLRNTLLPCVSFLPCEQLITPRAIRYEMIRRFGVPTANRDVFSFYWFDWGIVDGRFLTIFLLYLNYKALVQKSDARKCVKKMILMLNKETVSHRETCLNLLGWVHKERRDVRRAVQCFIKSLKVRPEL